MRAGKLDKQITIQRYTAIIDEGGGSTFTWNDLVTVRAQIIQQSTEEFLRAYGATDDTIIIFRTRWIDDIDVKDRVLYNGGAFNIKELKPIGRNRGLDIRAVA